MKIIIDTDINKIIQERDDRQDTFHLYSQEAFELISHLWLKIGWNQKHTYTFSWLGRPIIQLPQDMVRIQEVIYQVKPDIIVETGIAHGGSLVFYASLCKSIGRGKIIGIDIKIRQNNRIAIESHELYPFITLIEGDSIAPETVNQVKSNIKPGETVMVILDSCHSKQHVLSELEAYHSFVTPQSYIVATDGFMKYLYDVPRGYNDWKWDNPATAAIEFVEDHPEFVIEAPSWLFNESELDKDVTHWPGAWLRRHV